MTSAGSLTADGRVSPMVSFGADGRVSPMVSFAADGRVQVRTGKVEIGQGLHTALAQIVADELRVAVERVDLLPVDTAHSPDQGVTSGSLSVQDAGRALRAACAALREAGDLPPPSPSAVPDRAVGRSLPRRELPALFAGRPHFIHDLSLPGLLHGRVLRAPRPGVALQAADEAALQRARGLPGLHALWRDGALFGLLAASSGHADVAAARVAAALSWDEREAPDEGPAALRRLPAATRTVAEQGALPATGRQLQAAYGKPWIAHASLAPSCALARWTGGRLEVWSHSQGIFNLRRDLALAFDIDEAAVIVHHVPGAGCYGHNGADDAAFDAAWLARRADGRAVRALWSRADEMTQSPAGPAMAMALTATFKDRPGAPPRITGWQHDLWSPGHSRRPGRSATPALLGSWQTAAPHAASPSIDMPLATGGGAERNAVPGYAFDAMRVRCHSVVTHRRSSALRALGAFANVFAAESFVDEIARAAGCCPLALRRAHLAHDARGLAVLDAAAGRAGWASRVREEAVGHGIGYARYKGTGAWCAVVAEVQVGATLRVRRLSIAVDVGQPVNPDGVVNQIEGGAIQAASWALLEAAAPRINGWAEYPILRFSEVPAVDVVVMPSVAPSLGAGEAALGPTAGAIANALFDALGVRVRELPLTPERIVAAMETAE